MALTLIPVLLAFVVALAVSAVASPGVARLAVAVGVVDRPTARSVNQRPNVPLLGGLAVAIGLFVGLSASLLASRDPAPLRGHLDAVFLGGGLLLALGALDDRWSLKPHVKLLGQCAAAMIALLNGFRIEKVTDPVSLAVFVFPEWMVWTVTTLWIVGITNAINLMDGLDGCAAGVGLIIAATLTYVCWQMGLPAGLVLGVAFVGAVLGFLPYNFPPARMFLGDTGALFIGYVLALISLEGFRKVTVLTFVVPLLALAVPILDTALSIVRRVRRRRHIFTPDREHMHHRLLEAAGTQRSAVLSIYFLTSCFCVIAVSFTRLQGYAAVVFLGAVVVLTIRLLRNLGFFDMSPVGVSPAQPASGERKQP